MTGKALYILFLSLLPLAIAVAVVARQRGRLGLLHIHLILVALSYGAYTTVDVLINPVDEMDEWTTTVLMLSVTACMAAMLFALKLTSTQFRLRVSVEFLVGEARRTPALMLFILWATVVLWNAFVYANWGIISQAAGMLLDVPRWVGPVRQLSLSIGFGLFIWLTARVAVRQGAKVFSLDLGMLLVLVVLLTVNGRRVFLSLIVVGLIVFLTARGKLINALTVGNVVRVALAFGAFLLFSNVYQSARGTILATGGLETPMGIGVVDAIFDFQATTENLQARQAIWRFHYIVANAQVKDVTDVIGGEILASGFVGAVPNVFYPDKPPVYGDDYIICEYYREGCPSFWLPDFDLPQTLLSTVHADFGFLYVVLVPAVIFAVLLTVSFFGRLSQNRMISPVLYVLVFGMAVELLVNVEQSIGNYIIWIRDVGIVVIVIGLSQILTRGSKHGVNVGT